MKPGKKLVIKVVGFIIQPNEKAENEILGFLSVPGVPYRFVGGNIDPGEAIEEALYREIEEESGLKGLRIVRKLGIQHYYKEFIDANVQRHDYLLMPTVKLPERWEHTGTGGGGDDGLVFKYKWLGKEEHGLIDPEFRDYLNKDYISELFN
ncbi:NUDIX domain-containing protein [Paenibacillaceae bacterium WGS1546]|uniref:NUDIX domain-containing protein n=1 Tax=Cohnella sp. WGS1546 TaxID=3366810 RepID=UPI00372D820A